MNEHVQTGYGYIFFDNIDNKKFLDLYIPIYMLDQLQLLPGSAVLASGIKDKELSFITLRADKDVDNPQLGKFRFLASVRFPNRPGTLKKFLADSRKNIGYASIRTHGFRAQDRADVFFEGGMHQIGTDPNLAQAIRTRISEAAAGAEGDVREVTPMSYANMEDGTVMTSCYVLDLPIVGGEFGKVRCEVSARPSQLKGKDGTPGLVRILLHASTLSLQVDCSLLHQSAYLLAFEAKDFHAGAPVTSTILEHLSGVNVETVDAFEYMEHDAESMIGQKPRRIGKIQMLLVSGDSLDVQKATRDIENGLKDEVIGLKELDLRIQDLDRELGERSKSEPEVIEDTNCRCFRKLLKNGRYYFLERRGGGSFGITNKYLDLKEGKVVAGKHIRDVYEFRTEEIRTLIRAAEIEESPHLVKYYDCFYDGTIPVLVMEFVEYTLAENSHNTDPKRDEVRRMHQRPKTLSEFCDMAIQLLEGLRSLHIGTENQIVHRDIKPENIGLTVFGDRITWKLLDFGLAKFLPADGGPIEGSRPVGAYAYRSPQARTNQVVAQNDIFSLGVVFYKVLNNWQHPGTIQRIERYPICEEIEDYVSALSRGMTPRVVGFPREKWHLGEPFSSGDIAEAAKQELQDIVYGMLEFSLDLRWKNASQVGAMFENWRNKWLAKRDLFATE